MTAVPWKIKSRFVTDKLLWPVNGLGEGQSQITLSFPARLIVVKIYSFKGNK